MVSLPKDERLAYSREEAAEMLGVTKRTLDRLVLRGLIRPNRVMRRPLFPRSELERFLNSRTNR